MNQSDSDFVFDPNMPPPTAQQLAGWKQQLMQELQFYEQLLQRRLWYGIAALLFLLWYVFFEPETLGATLAGLAYCLGGTLIVRLLFDAMIGQRPATLSKRIRSLSPVDATTLEVLETYAKTDPAVDIYLQNLGERAPVWAEYWMISVHNATQTDGSSKSAE